MHPISLKAPQPFDMAHIARSIRPLFKHEPRSSTTSSQASAADGGEAARGDIEQEVEIWQRKPRLVVVAASMHDLVLKHAFVFMVLLCVCVTVCGLLRLRRGRWLLRWLRPLASSATS